MLFVRLWYFASLIPGIFGCFLLSAGFGSIFFGHPAAIRYKNLSRYPEKPEVPTCQGICRGNKQIYLATPASRFEQKNCEQKNCRKMQFYTPDFPTYRWAGSNLPKGGSVSWNPLEPQNWCLGALLGTLGATKLIQKWWETEIFWWKTRQNSGKVSSWKKLLHKRNYKTGAWEPFGSYKIDSKMVRNRNFLMEKLEKTVEKYHRELQNWC